MLKKPATKDVDFDPAHPDPSTSSAPYRIFNIGNSNPVKLDQYIEAIELALNKKAIKEFLDMQPGDVAITSSDCSSLKKWINYRPTTSIKDGVNKFINWYLDFYNI